MKSASNINKRSRGVLRSLTIVAVIVISLGLTNAGPPLSQDPTATLPSKPMTNSNSNNANKSGTKKTKRRRRSSAVAAERARQGPIQAEQETADAKAEVARERQRRTQAEQEAADAKAEVALERQRRTQAEQEAADTTAGAVAREQQRRIQAERVAADATAAVAHERQRRIQAEQVAADARAAQARAEQEMRRKKDVWLMATVRNLTKGPIIYQVLCNDLWSSLTLNPGYQTVYVCLNDDISLKYDYKYAPGVQERIYRLEATPMVGHRPTDGEQARARVNFFQVDRNGDIEVFSNP